MADYTEESACAGRGPRFYNGSMAKGWESKSVESQMDAAEERRDAERKEALTEEQKKRKREQQGLLLAQANLRSQLEASTNELYRQTLQAALDDLERRIEALGE